jgi:hypothetical protein
LNCIGIKVVDRERVLHSEEEVKLRGAEGDEAAEHPTEDANIEKLGFFDDNLIFYLGKGGH